VPQDPESHWATRSVIAWLRVPRFSKWLAVYGTMALSAGVMLSAISVSGTRTVDRFTSSESCPVGGQHVPGAADSWGGCWPNADNAGLPAGTSLTTYTGGCTINTTNATVNAKDVLAACPDGLEIAATGVTITNSSLPLVLVNETTGSLTISDSKIDAGDQLNFAGLSNTNYTATRIEVIGGQHSTQCAANCTIVDSYLHDQRNPMPATPHNNAFISNGGSDMTLRHNTLWCTTTVNANDGGCSADLSLFGDFEAIDDVLVDKNLLMANGSNIPYCTYAGSASGKPFPNATNVRYLDNVFQKGTTGKCGVFGAVTIFDSGGTGNVWTNNKYDDGSTVSSSL
jgi:hypothetical protein